MASQPRRRTLHVGEWSDSHTPSPMAALLPPGREPLVPIR
jgi:hypothetical protein